MKEYIIENKKTIIIIGIFLVVLIILSIVVKLLGNTNQLLITAYVSKLEKEDITLEVNDCDLDYVLKYNNIPYFNLNTEVFNELNEEIFETFLLRTCYQDGEINYEASLNDNILSVALNISYATDDDLAYLEYKTYNINSDENIRMNNQDILKRYNLTLENVTNIVLSHLRTYYDYELEKGYINDFSFQYYLTNILNYTPITINNMNLYIDSNNDLYIYKDYTLSEGMSIDEDFPYITIKFKLA